MSDETTPTTGPAPEALHPEVVEPTEVEADTEADAEEHVESIEQPAKLLRIGSMVKQLLEEVRQAPLDEASRVRLREIYEQSVRELAETPSESELRIAHAQLVGWLEGLFHGIQATLVAQQVAARAQLDEMRQRSLAGGDGNVGRPGTYL